MKTIFRLLFVSAISFFVVPTLVAQSTPAEIFHQQIQEAIDNGTYPGETCGNQAKKQVSPQLSMACTILSNGYGTNGWQPSSGDACNRDANCDVPAVPNTTCNGGKYRLPIAITIFECAAWTGENYNNNTSIGGSNNATGFIALADTDLNNTLATVNEHYANANIEFYEVQRVRVEDCDIYDFYDDNPDPTTGGNDGMNDNVQTQAYDLPNVINLYFVGGLEGDHDCCGVYGFAPYPMSRDYSIMRYPPGIGGTTIAHELGHYFGLFHTHHDLPSNFADIDGYPNGALNNSDCLTTGDGICDTWPDPNFSHNCDHSGATYDRCYVSGCDFDATGFAAHSHGASNVLSIDPGEGVDCAAQPCVSTILEQNIMSYNSLSGCRTDFSYCQYRKIYDIATDDGCRAYLCHSDPAQYFASTVLGAANSPYQEICTGDAIPTFNAGKTYTSFAGVSYDINCFDWFLGQNDMKASALATNVSTFTPTAAQVDVNTPGVYSFWIAEVNTISDPPCKSEITIVVQPDPGTASAMVTDPTPSTKNACYDTDIISLPAGKVIGWWITDTDPITSTVTNAATFTTALAGATMGGALTNPANHIYESTGGTPKNDFCLDIDCSLFAEGTNIYATPFVTCSSPLEAAAECSASASGSPVSVSGNLGSVSGLVDFTTASCPTNHSGAQTWSVVLTIDAYAGGTGTLNLNVRGNNACTNANFLFFDGLAAPAVGSTYTYTSVDFPAGYDPTQPGSEICALIWDPGTSTGTLGFTLEVIRQYAEVPAVTFPTGDYYSCVFGAPHLVVCATSLPIELIGFNGQLENEEVLLDWATEVEINNAYFTIEKSTDGRNFEALGMVEGQGTSYEKHTYNLIDKNPTAGINYYRLSQTDFDKHQTYVGVVTIQVLKEKEIEIMPNPIHNNILSFNYSTQDNGALEFAVYDVTGKLITNQIFSVEVGLNNQSLPLEGLSGGVYFVVAKQNEKVMTERFTKIE